MQNAFVSKAPSGRELPTESGEGERVTMNLAKLKVTQAPSVTATPCHLPLRGRLFVSPIITQIGRENKFSAEILLLRTVEDACPYKCCVKHPYEKEPKASAFFNEINPLRDL